MQRVIRLRRRIRMMMKASTFCALASFGGCALLDGDSELSRVFREAYVPGLLEGLSTAVTTPENAEAGLRRTATAFFEGVAAVLTPEPGREPGD